jgi:hypothetical protein
MPIIILRDETADRTLPIWPALSSECGALQIEAPPRRHDPRPAAPAGDEPRCPITRVVITDLRDGTSSRIQPIEPGTSSTWTRPSDALSVPSQPGPIFSETSVLDHAVVDIASPDEATGSGCNDGWRVSIQTTSATRCSDVGWFS